MSEQIIKYNSRVIQKHDTSDNWSKATDFIPLSGEIIVYDDLRKIKIGNGTTKVNDLLFNSSTFDELVAGDKIDIVIDSKNNSATISHETLPKDSSTTLSATAKGTNNAEWDKTSLVTGVEITRDNYGHITDVGVTSIKMPANPDTNTIYAAGDGLKLSGTSFDTFDVLYGDGIRINCELMIFDDGIDWKNIAESSTELILPGGIESFISTHENLPVKIEGEIIYRKIYDETQGIFSDEWQICSYLNKSFEKLIEYDGALLGYANIKGIIE